MFGIAYWVFVHVRILEYLDEKLFERKSIYNKDVYIKPFSKFDQWLKIRESKHPFLIVSALEW